MSHHPTVTPEPPRLPQDVLDIADKRRSNPLAWRGQFSPQLVEAHLAAYARPGALVLDPFAGSGAVLLESLRRGLPSVGAEVNPAAVSLARVYTTAALAPAERVAMLERLDTAVEAALDRAAPATALLALLGGTARPATEALLLEALVVASDLGCRPDPAQIRRRWQALGALVRELPHAPRPPRVCLADARALPLSPSSVDLVLTSPPYVNVFNYHQQYRASVEALGWKVLPIARSEIASNRKFRGNRLLTVAQYCLDMTLCLLELRRLLRPSGRVVVVVGRESDVRKTAFYNGRILGRLATEAAGFDVVLEQERAFVNRYGRRIREDILHLCPLPAAPPGAPLDRARAVARQVLEEALGRAPDAGVRADLARALGRLPAVEPSPLLDLGSQPAARLCAP